jgi:hypothetical protein
VRSPMAAGSVKELKMCNFTIFRSWRGWLGAIAASLVCPLAAQATPTINLGTYNLQPNQSGQVINIYVSDPSGFPAESAVFTLTTGDGGPQAGGASGPSSAPMYGGQHDNAPLISFVNVSTAVLINGVSTNPLFPPGNNNYNSASIQGGPTLGLPQFYAVSYGTSSGSVEMSGTPVYLCQATIDTTGFFSGSFSISALGTENGQAVTQDTQFSNGNPQPVNAIGTDGLINIVPEPASLGLLGLAIPALLLRRRSRSPIPQHGA